MPAHLVRLMSRARARGTALVLALSACCAVGASAATAAPSERILILGDSISQGTAGDVTWRYRLWESLQASPSAGDVDFIGGTTELFNVARGRQDGNHDYAYPSFDQDHESTWGTTLATVTPLLPSKLAALPQQPTVIVVELGTNDAPAGAAKALGLMRRLIASARMSAPGVDIVMQVPFAPVDPATGRALNVAYTQSFAAGLDQIAAQLSTPTERVLVAPTTGFDAMTSTWDGHHPNALGELALARTTATALAQLGIGDGPHVPASAEWPEAGPTPTVTFSGPRASVTWPDSTPGALAYALEQRHTTAAGAASDWTLLVQPARTARAWNSPVLVTGDRYDYRLVPVRGKMRGQPGAVAGGVAPAPAPARRPWWQLW